MAENQRLDFWTELLHLEGFRVAHIRQDAPDDPLRLTLVPSLPLGLCPQCHRVCDTVHGHRESQPVKDLPISGHEVNLIFRLSQFQCPHCSRYFTPTPEAWPQGAHATERFLEHAARFIRISDIANVALVLGVPEKTLEAWYYDYVERQRREPLTPPRPIQQIGIDELRINQGANPYAAVIVDHTNQRVLEVLENRLKDTVQDYLQRGRDSGFLAGVIEVTTDMWGSYGEAAQEVFGKQVRITIDRFHVMKNFQEHLTAARREIQRTLSKEEAKALKGTRWLWLTNQENLSRAEEAELAALGEQFPLLKQLREQRDKLRGLFEGPSLTTARAGAQRLRGWLEEARALGLKALEGFCKTLENWLDKIANYFIDRASNGRVEGYNRGLRGILWRAFGIPNFKHFRLRVLDRFGQPKLA